MYRQQPTTCTACGSAIEAYEADHTDQGLRCWRCSTRAEVDGHHKAVRERPEARRRERRAALLHAALGVLMMIITATVLVGALRLLHRLGL